MGFLLTGAGFATPVSAATITVNSILDTSGDTGICTLRDAVASANTDTANGGCDAGSGDDTIVFDAGLSAQTITLGSTLSLGSNLTLDGSTLASNVKISGNNACRVFIVNAGKTVSLDHVDVVNGKNPSSGSYNGGGIYNGASGILTLGNSTFSGNTTPSYVHSSSIYNAYRLTINNNIFANGSYGDCENSTYATIVSAVGNLIESVSYSCGLTNGIDGNIIGVDPNLGALSDNGGPTQTMALPADSPAINAGDADTCTAADQRGYARVENCDIGAFENQAPPPNAPSELTATAVSQTRIDLSWTDNSGNETGFKIYRDSVELTPSPIVPAGTVTFSDTGLNCGTSYAYEVKATNANGDSQGIGADATTQACPSVVSVDATVENGAYKAGEIIPVRVVFTEAVTVGGTPRLTLNVGTPYSVDYSSGSGTDSLIFGYTVAAGHTSADLDYANSAAPGHTTASGLRYRFPPKPQSRQMPLRSP